MRIRFEFSLSEPIHLQDRWPIKVDGVVYAFLGDLNKITRVVATLLEQPITFAPEVDKTTEVPTIRFRHGALLPTIRERLDQVQCTLGILLPIEIDTDNYVVNFEAEHAEEEGNIVIKSWSVGRRPHNNRVPFDIAAKGLLADRWPENERKAAQFYRRGRAAVNDRYFVDAFVNYYFFLERLYAGVKFKTSEVARRFAIEPDLQKAYTELESKPHAGAILRGAPLGKGLEEFCEWVVNRRGFFQHQSESDPSRWLHATQEEYAPEALLLAEFAMSVYNIRNAHRMFGGEIDQRWLAAATEVNATMDILIDIIGDDPEGQPFRKQIVVNGPGTRVTLEIARQTLLKCMELADKNLIAVRQMTATVKGTHELVFSYTGPPTPRIESAEGKVPP